MSTMQPYQVGGDGPWSDREAAHLYRRAGFGATPGERLAAVGDGSQAALEAAVDALVDFFPADPWLDRAAGSTAGDLGDPFADLPDGSPLAGLKDPQNAEQLFDQWAYRMRYTSQPLQEQLTLFFHDHMPIEGTKILGLIPNEVDDGNDGSATGQNCTSGTLPPLAGRKFLIARDLMTEYIQLFRTGGADDFHDLLIAITRNPAMLAYLDNVVNIAGRAQENYAREVMELFSMGVDNYTEFDIQQIAKCFTGETLPYFRCDLDWSTAYGFVAQQGPSVVHALGNKTVFGQTVAYSNSGQETLDVIGLILDKVSINPPLTGVTAPYQDLPAAAIYMAWKLLSWFVSNEVRLSNPENGGAPDDVVLELADFIRGTDNAPYPQRRYAYDIRAALRRIFTSQYFYGAEQYYTMYKNPADFVIGALRCLELPEQYGVNGGPAIQMAAMGMTLFVPPNVAGWNHGAAWINSGSTVVRANFAARLGHIVLSYNAAGNALIDPLMARNGGPIADHNDDAGFVEYFRELLIQDALTAEEEAALLAFLATVPGSGDTLFRNKVRGLIHVMLTMPRYQLK